MAKIKTKREREEEGDRDREKAELWHQTVTRWEIIVAVAHPLAARRGSCCFGCCNRNSCCSFPSQQLFFFIAHSPMAPLSAPLSAFGRIFAAGSRLKGASKHSKRLKRKPLAQLAAAQFLFVLSHLDAVLAIPCMHCSWGKLVTVHVSHWSDYLCRYIFIKKNTIYYVIYPSISALFYRCVAFQLRSIFQSDTSQAIALSLAVVNNNWRISVQVQLQIRARPKTTIKWQSGQHHPSPSPSPSTTPAPHPPYPRHHLQVHLWLHLQLDQRFFIAYKVKCLRNSLHNRHKTKWKTQDTRAAASAGNAKSSQVPNKLKLRHAKTSTKSCPL